MNDQVEKALWPPEASRIRLLCLDLRVWLGRRFITQTSGKRSVIDIGFGQIVKEYACEMAREVKASKYIREHTPIPVPAVYGAWIDKRDDFAGPTCHFIMERVEGETLLEAWSSLSSVDLSAIAAELGGYVDQMRVSSRPIW
jgi:hypothetical protein